MYAIGHTVDKIPSLLLADLFHDEEPKTEIVKVSVSPDDIRGARSTGLDNPIMRALQRLTRTMWCLSDMGVAFEVEAPFRTIILGDDVFDCWCAYIETKTMSPFEFIAEILPADKLPWSYQEV